MNWIELNFSVTDGVFDAKAYTEKSLNRVIKAKLKAERAQQRAPVPTTAASVSASVASSAAPSKAPTPVPPEEGFLVADARVYESMELNAGSESHVASGTTNAEKEKEKVTTTPATRVELLRLKLSLVAKFTRLLVPVLVDVYAASVASQVRTKTLVGLLKAVSFLDGEDLKNALKVSCCYISCFSFSILIYAAPFF